MPKGKLKSSLLNHQSHAAHKKKQAAAQAAAASRAAAGKHSAKEKKAMKRQRQAREALQRERDFASTAVTAAAKAEEDGVQADDDETNEADEPIDEAGPGVPAAPENGEAAVTGPSFKADPAMLARLKAVIPIATDDTVLLLGEGNFSFARALVEGRGHAGHLVCATAYDSEAETYKKYPDAEENVAALREAGTRVAFGVDSGALERAHKAVGRGPRWSRVVFNFPHVGSGTTDQDRNIRENQMLLLRTLRSVSPLLTQGPTAFPLPKPKKKAATILLKHGKHWPRAPRIRSPSPNAWSDNEALPDEADDDDDDDDARKFRATRAVPASFTPPLRQGTFVLSLLSQAPYTLWDAARLATRPPTTIPGEGRARGAGGPPVRYRLLRSFDFIPAAWPGYAHRRTIGWREGLSKAANEEIVGRIGKARTWEFCVWDGDDEE